MGLPGDVIKLIVPTEPCEKCGELAKNRMQGETDSFGCEWLYLCSDCTDVILAEIKADNTEEVCAWCKTTAKLGPVRDWEEGLNGPVYYVCGECRTKQNQQLFDMEDDY